MARAMSRPYCSENGFSPVGARCDVISAGAGSEGDDSGSIRTIGSAPKGSLVGTDAAVLVALTVDRHDPFAVLKRHDSRDEVPQPGNGPPLAGIPRSCYNFNEQGRPQVVPGATWQEVRVSVSPRTPADRPERAPIGWPVGLVSPPPRE